MDFILRVKYFNWNHFVMRSNKSDGHELAYWVMTQAFWLAALNMDGPITGNITALLHVRLAIKW